MDNEKVEILFPTIERWYCVDLMLKNLDKAEKPKDTQILTVVSASDRYAAYLEKRLGYIFKKVRVVTTGIIPIGHDKIRENTEKKWLNSDNVQKINNVHKTYTCIKENIDREMDYYWFIEDDTLFPLNTYSRLKSIMDGMNGDVVSGISYFWHEHVTERDPRNFWILQVIKVFGESDTSNEITFKVLKMPSQESGVAKLGATGLGNVLAKKGVVLNWIPQNYVNIGSGADISFFYDAHRNGFKIYGIWDLFLPHITKYSNGDIQIMGKIDRSLHNIIGARDEENPC